jgi:hypothetical protein
MSRFIDFYYLVDNRGLKFIYDFFHKYDFIEKEVCDDYPIPQYSDNFFIR